MGDVERILGVVNLRVRLGLMPDDVAAVTDGSFLIGEVDLDLDFSLIFRRRALRFSGGLSGGEDSR